MNTLATTSFMVALAVSAIAAPIATVQRQDLCAAAFDSCIFTFAGETGIPTYPLGNPGQAISPAIVYKDDDMMGGGDGGGPVVSPDGGVSPFGGAIVGSVDATAEAFVVTEDGPVLISDFDCPNQRFSSSFIKAANLGSSALSQPISGASHESLQGNQGSCLDGVCIIMTMQKWQSFTDEGVTNIVSSPSDFLTNCAVFKLER